ncbi:MAG: single-stranded DNA-binding protein [bacterium]
MDLNKAMIIGRLTRDPEVRQTGTGQAVASFGMATNMSWTDKNGQKQDKVEFHNIVAWRGLAEVCGRYLKKGSKIYVEGRIQTRDWQAQDGSKRYTTEITAENMIMLDTRGGGDSGASNFQQSANNQAETPTISYDEPDGQGEDEIKVENIPF